MVPGGTSSIRKYRPRSVFAVERRAVVHPSGTGHGHTSIPRLAQLPPRILPAKCLILWPPKSCGSPAHKQKISGNLHRRYIGESVSTLSGMAMIFAESTLLTNPPLALAGHRKWRSHISNGLLLGEQVTEREGWREELVGRLGYSSTHMSNEVVLQAWKC